MAINMKLVGAVAIKVRPDTSGFRKDAEDDIERQLQGREVEFKVKAKVKADTSEMKRDVEKAGKEIEAKRFQLKVGLDYDSVKAAQKQLDAAVKGLSAKEVNVKLNEKGLAKAQAQIDKLMAKAKVEVDFVPDKAGYESVLQKIAAIRREQITQTIKFGVDETSLLTQEKFARSMLRQLGVDITYSNDNASIRKAIAEVDARLKEFDDVTINVKLDQESLLAERARLESLLQHEPVTIKVDYDDQASLKKARDRVTALLSEMKAVDLDVNVSQEKLERLRHQLDSFINDEEDKSIDLPVGLTGLSLVATRLAYASRTRHVSFFVTVNAKSLAVAEGLLRSLAGLNVLTSTGRFLENMISSFDQIAIKGAGWSSVIASISNSLVYMLTALFGIGAGMAKMVGLLAVLPAIAAALAAAVIINVMAFKNFKSAIDGDAEALAALPPIAREAAQSLTGVWTSIQRPVQEAFWSRMGTSIQDFVTHVIPELRDGLASVAPAAGAMLSNTIKAFTKLALGGDMKTMFANLARSFEITALAAEPLVDAINTLGLRGSYFLPRMAQWLTDITIRFDNWIQKSEKAGNINRWIEEGVDALHATWEAGGAIVDMFRALAHSAEDAGTGGLLTFRDNMRSVADTMLGEPFRTRMALFFAGSRDGASALNEGIKALADSFGESAYWVDRLLVGLGQLSGDVLIQLSRVISNIKFQEGLLDALRGMQEALVILTPGFDALGGVIGNLGTLAGGIFTNVAPIINSVMRIIGDSFNTLGGSLAGLVPTLTGLVNGLLVAFEGPFGTIVNILNAALTALNALPSGIQSVVIAMIGMLLLRGQFAPFFLGIANGWARMAAAATGSSTVVIRSWTATGVVANTVATGIAASTARIVASSAVMRSSFTATATAAAATSAATIAAMNTQANGIQAAFLRIAGAAGIGARGVTTATGIMRVAFGTVAGAASLAATGTQIAMSRLVGAVAGAGGRVATGIAGISKTLLSLAGGWVGLGILAIGTAIAVIGSNAAKAKGDADALKGSLDELGNVTAATSQLNIQKIIDDNQANIGNINGAMKSASESILILGGSIEEVGIAATQGGPKFDALIAKLKELDKLKQAATITTNGKVDPAAQNALDTFVKTNNLSAEAVGLNAVSIQHLIGFLQGLRDPTQKATSDFLLANDAVDKATPRTLAWNDALKVLNDTTSTSSRRVEALKDALDILNGKSVDGFKITRNYNDQVRAMQGFLTDATKAAEGLDEAQAKADANNKRRALNSTVNTKTGEINTSTDMGSSLSKQLESLQDTAIEVAIQFKDDGSIDKASKSLDDARNKWITMATQAGISAENAGLAWDSMIGGIPEDIKTTLGLEIDPESGTKLGDFGAGLEAIAARKTVAKIVGDDQDLAQKIIDSSTSLDTFNQTVATATMNLDPTQATEVRNQLLVELAEYANSDPTAKANIDPDLFNARRDELMRNLADLNAQRPNPIVNAQIKEAQRQLDIINAALDGTNAKRPTPVVDPETNGANQELNATNSMLDVTGAKRPVPQVILAGGGQVMGELMGISSYLTNLNGKTANTYVVNRVTSIFDEQHTSTGVGGSGGQTRNADGNILNGRGVQTFASGGFSEMHLAKIFTPRTNYRVFAEPETGGEAYIPMSISKRERSTAILKEVAERFGYELKRNSTSYAGGTQVPGGGDSSGVTFNIKSIVAVDAEAAVRKLRVSQMDALATAGITNGGAV